MATEKRRKPRLVSIPESVRASATTRPAREQRERLIAEAAYYHAERRGFAGNRELEDWLAAEREIDSRAADAES